MKKDTVAVVAILWVAAFFGAVLWLYPVRAHADSRVYPYVGIRYRIESSEAPKARAEIGAAFSAGRLAPAVTGSVALNGRFSPGVDLSLRWRL